MREDDKQYYIKNTLTGDAKPTNFVQQQDVTVIEALMRSIGMEISQESVIAAADGSGLCPAVHADKHSIHAYRLNSTGHGLNVYVANYHKSNRQGSTDVGVKVTLSTDPAHRHLLPKIEAKLEEMYAPRIKEYPN